MKKFLAVLLLTLTIVSSCLDGHFDKEDENRYFMYRNTIPYYFYDADSVSLIDIHDSYSYPLSYVGDYLPEVKIYSQDANGLFLTNYDGIGVDSTGKYFWYCYNKGCYDSTHFSYNVRARYNHDQIDVQYLFDTLDQYNVTIYLHKLTYNGVIIRAYEEDSTKFISADHVDVYKYKDSTVVKPFFKEK